MKHTGFITAIVLSSFALTATTALAKGPGRGNMPSFQELDADGNGEVTKAEMETFRSTKITQADTDGDGKLSADEMRTAAHSRADARVDAMFERHDADKDGFLSADELPKPKRADKMFKRMDADGNGAISEQEFADASDKMRRHHKKHRHGSSDGN